jgi:uncharacterized protein with FMN-binding domain
MDIKKISFLVLVLLAFTGFVIYERFFNGSNAIPIVNNSQQTSPNNDNNPTNQTTKNTNQQQQPATGYKDGQYTGTVADAVYGQLQVKAVISQGKITDVQFLQYPNHSGHTTEVSNMALPQLKSEAIQAQSANVDIVSGATQTSQAFMQSLQSALTQAN